MADEQPSASERGDEQAEAPERESRLGDLRHYVPPDLLNVSFPGSVRGYDRAAVDAYVKRVNRVIAELKVSASPRAAVTHALEQTEQQVSGLLRRARETGEEITASAREEAGEIVARGKAEAAELLVNVSADADGIKADAERIIAEARTEAEDTLVRARLEAENIVAHARADAEKRRQELEEKLAELREQAERRMRELQTDTDDVRSARDELLAEIRRAASGLGELADAATRRDGARAAEEREREPESVDEVERAGAEAIAAGSVEETVEVPPVEETVEVAPADSRRRAT